MSERIYIRLKVKPIEEYILKNNLSCRQLAHLLGYDSAQISNWLNGKRFVSARARQRLQDFFKWEWDELFKIVEDSELLKLSEETTK